MLSDQSLGHVQAFLCSHWLWHLARWCLVNIDNWAGLLAPLQINWQCPAVSDSGTLWSGVERFTPQLIDELSSPSGGFRLSPDRSELAHPVFVTTQVLFFVLRVTQSDKLKPVHFIFATQQSRSGHTGPDNLTKTSQSASVTVVPKRLIRGPTVNSQMKSAEDPTAMSYHPADNRVIRLQSTSNSRLSRVLHCAQHLSQCSCCSFHSAHGCVTLHWRSFQQSSLSTSRLHLTENEAQRFFWSDRSFTLTSDRRHASSIARKNSTRISLAAFTVRAAAIDWLSLSTMLKMVRPGLASCMRLDRNMKSHSTLGSPLELSVLR